MLIGVAGRTEAELTSWSHGVSIGSMQDAWEREGAIWDEHFGGLGGDLGRTYRETPEAFWELFDAQMQEHFPAEAFFSMDALVPEPFKAQRARTSKSIEDSEHRFFGVLKIKDELAALFSGSAYSAHAWRMWTTVVAPKFRRQGIYAQILQGHLGYSKALGFDVVRSEHAPCNSAILIAKLKAGFCLTAMEIDAAHGNSVILTYFHHPQQKNAYLVRCGMASMTPELLASGNPSMKRLARQFAEEA